MARKTKWPPEVRQQAGMDYVRVQHGGKRRKWTLGPSGSDLARAEYLRVCAEVEAGRLLGAAPGCAVSVLDVCIPYMDRCVAEVDPRQVFRVRAALRPVIELYGLRPADEFGPLALEAVRATYVAGGYCRDLCNAMTSVVRQAFRWAASREIVPPALADRLETLGPLLAGRTEAPDRPEVEPVSDADVAATLPHLSATLADMVRVQLLTGCRPGELVLLRGADVLRPWKTFDGVAVWLYKLERHKTAWKGGRRTIAVGPRAQAVLLPYLDGRAPERYCFVPAEVAAARKAARRAARKTPVQPSQADRSRESPRRPPGERYTTQSYGGAIERACRRAGVERWAPNRLRHNAGTRVEADWGREDARSVLGHADASTTAIYAEMSERAGRVAARDG